MKINILLADNDEDVLKSFTSYLKQANFNVFSASSPQEAAQVLDKERIHIGVIDVRLTLNSNREDTSGLKIIETYKDIHNIGWVTMTSFLEARPIEDAFPLSDELYIKQPPVTALLDKVKNVIEKKHLQDCSHRYANGYAPNWKHYALNTSHLAELLDKRVSEDDIAEELEELFCRILNKHDLKEVRLERPNEGRSGAGIFYLYYQRSGVAVLPYVIKLDTRENAYIEDEKNRYRTFIDGVLDFVPELKETTFKTKYLEAIVYSFRGNGGTNRLTDLAHVYHGEETAKLVERINFVFDQLVEPWWRDTQIPQKTPKTVAQLYKTHWKLGDQSHKLQRIRDQIDRIASNEMFRASLGLIVTDDSVSIGSEIYHNPLDFVYGQSRINEYYAGFERITHGDMNARNLLSSLGHVMWLIDFSYTGYGHELRDFTELETCIRYELFQPSTIYLAYKFEEATYNANDFALSDIAAFADKNSNKALQLIKAIRKNVLKRAEKYHLQEEYLIGLIFNALQVLAVKKINDPREPLMRAQAFISAAIACTKLDRKKIVTAPLSPEILDSVSPRVLFLASNPQGTGQLNLGEEMRQIQVYLRQNKQDAYFDIKQQWAARYRDLVDALIEFKPNIVHFSGHGTQNSEIILHYDSGEAHALPASVLSKLFEIFTDQTKCVVLNACWSLEQAKAIAEKIPYVIGMSQPVTDDAAILFASRFYSTLASKNNDYLLAFKLACLEIEAHLPEKSAPRLLYNKDGEIREIMCS